MSDHTTRRGFLAGVGGGLAATLLPSTVRATPPQPAADVHPGFPRQDPGLVREVVAASHARLDRVRELVTASPALAKAAWDWGFGDWESALGAASHMGRRDIAELLMSHGARPNLFTFAMMGNLDAVRGCIARMPGAQRTRGPHGITLLQHARNGGKPAEAVVEFLGSVGDADIRATSLQLPDEEKTTYTGRYRFGPGEQDSFEVLTNRQGSLAIQRGDEFSRTLHRVEDHAFAPTGAPSVRIRFVLENNRAISLTVHDPHPLMAASRVK